MNSEARLCFVPAKRTPPPCFDQAWVCVVKICFSSILRWMPANFCPKAPGRDCIRVVHLQSSDSCSSNRRLTTDDRAAVHPLEVLFPLLQAGVKQCCWLVALRVDCRCLARLVAVAERTSQRQVTLRCVPTLRFRYNVIDLQHRPDNPFGGLTVGAPPSKRRSDAFSFRL